MIVVLDNVRSIFNVGAIFRTSDAVGVEKLILSGYTPHPPELKLIKTSLGAQDYVEWNNFNNDETITYLNDLKNKGFNIVSIEQNNNSICYTEAAKNGVLTWTDTVYIFGNEITGVNKELLNISNYIVEIPMYGKKNSLNISVSVGIILYESRKYKPE